MSSRVRTTNGREGLAGWLIQRAARAAPPTLSERLAEEWMADLAARKGALDRLRLALGCCWAIRVIAHEHCVSGIAAAATGRTRTLLAYPLHGDDTYFSRRSVTVLLIIALHVGIVWAFASGLGHRALVDVVGRLVVVPVNAASKPKNPPPLPPPAVDFRPPKVDWVQRETPLDDPFASDAALTVTSESPVDHAGGALVIAPQVRRTAGGPGRGFPNTDEYYPSDAIRKGQEGAAVVHTCLDASGKLVAIPTIAQSSGTLSLDEGALKLAKAGSGHYRAATEDGRPVSSCFDFRVTFRVKGSGY